MYCVTTFHYVNYYITLTYVHYFITFPYVMFSIHDLHYIDLRYYNLHYFLRSKDGGDEPPPEKGAQVVQRRLR
jgi:hypothetical protein